MKILNCSLHFLDGKETKQIVIAAPTKEPTNLASLVVMVNRELADFRGLETNPANATLRQI